MSRMIVSDDTATAGDWHSSVGHVPLGGTIKRAFDIIAASFGLIVLSPVMILLALLVTASSGGSAFYRHSRVGHCGRMFHCLKFRSMHVDGDRILAHHLAVDAAAQREWSETQKLRNDPRVTPIGRVLRTYSLDELPQLWNVLKGDMSIVGPRPIVLGEVSKYADGIAEYLSARPGLTGLWQISGRSDTSYAQRIELDRRYVREWSFLGDVWIVLKTIPAVILRRGAC
jgi:exopolysaccharide production protein ExoY